MRQFRHHFFTANLDLLTFANKLKDFCKTVHQEIKFTYLKRLTTTIKYQWEKQENTEGLLDERLYLQTQQKKTTNSQKIHTLTPEMVSGL